MERTAAGFEQTNWSLIDALSVDDESAVQRAQEFLSKIYWPPIYACARRLTRTREEAADLTQAFFADMIYGQRLFEKAQSNRGRLRSLLRASLKHYAIDQWRRETARGQGRTIPLAHLEHEDLLLDGKGGDMDEVFDRRWALAVLERSLSLCESHFRSRDMAGHWRLFECRVVHPAARGTSPVPMQDLASRLGFDSAPQASAALQTVKRRLDVILRQVVGETVSGSAQASEEHKYILQLLGSSK